MHLHRTKILLLLMSLFLAAWGQKAQAAQEVRDSLERELRTVRDAKQKVSLLLDLKDVCEDSPMNLVYSRLLFDAACEAEDASAASIAAVPIINTYARYPEKADSVQFYLQRLRKATRDTEFEAMADYCSMLADFKHYAYSGITRDELEALAKEHYARKAPADNAPAGERAAYWLLHGLADSYIRYYRGEKHSYPKEIGVWERSWKAASELPLHPERQFMALIYYYLSGAYNSADDYPALLRLNEEYERVLDAYYRSESIARRKFLYKDNVYMRNCLQLIRGALNVGKKEAAYEHYRDFSRRMLAARGDHLRRNRLLLYETGYLLLGNVDRVNEAVAYCDSLIRMIERGEAGNYPTVERVYRDRAVLLVNAGRKEAACDAYERAMAVSDSLLHAEYVRRTEEIGRSRDVEALRLEEAHMAVHNRHIALIFSLAAMLVLTAWGFNLMRDLKRTRRLRDEILRENRRAQGSEQMKSAFIGSICRDIRAPYNRISDAAAELTRPDATACERLAGRNALRSNTQFLLSMLDSLLEAANLDSLTDDLPLERVDLSVICREEMAHAADTARDSNVEYICITPDEGCPVRTHRQYAAFVIRALLNNAAKFTRTGSITLRCRQGSEHAEISVEDTGCGIPSAKREAIFTRFTKLDASTPGNGLSLSLCRIVARRLKGDIRLDETYHEGARFLFTLPSDAPDDPAA